MIRIYCDRCGGEIPQDGEIGKMQWGFQKGMDGEMTSDLLHDKVFCERCMDSTMAYIMSHDGAENGQNEPKKSEPKKRRSRRSITCGKEIQKLYMAGKTYAEIAEQVGLNLKQVGNYIYFHRKEW